MLPQELQNIPGGPLTQIAQQSGNPMAVGLTPEQIQTGRDRITPKEEMSPIPIGLPGYDDVPEEPVQGEADSEEINIILPSGESIVFIAPIGMSDEAVINKLKALGEWDEGEDTSTLRNKARSVVQGYSFGTGEELGSLAAAGIAKIATLLPGEQAGEDSSFGDIYRDIVGTERSEHTKYKEQHPYESLGYEVAGGLATGVAGGAKLAGTTMAQKVGMGSAAGGLYGAAATDPTEGATTLENIGQRAKGGAIGATVGAIAPPVLTGVGKTAKAVLPNKVRKAMKTYDGRQKLNTTIEQNYMKYRATGQSNTEAYRSALKEAKVPAKDAVILQRESGKTLSSYRLTPEEAADRIVADGLFKKGVVHTGAMKIMDQALEPISRRIEKHSPRIAQLLRNYESDVYTTVHEWHTKLEPFIAHMRSLNRADEDRLASLLYNGKFDDAKKLLIASTRNPNIAKEFDDAIDLIKKIGMDIEDVGGRFDKVDNYFPRRIKDIEKLKNHLGDEYITGFQSVSNALRNKGPNREANALNAWMRGVPLSKRRESAMKSRKVREVSDEMMAKKLYERPAASLDLWLRDAAQQIHRRRFLGQGKTVRDFKLQIEEELIGKKGKASIENVTKSIDNLMDHLSDPSLSMAARNEIADLLKVRFTAGELGMDGFAAKVKAIAHNSLIGDMVSAVTQIGDIGASAWLHGFMPVLKALVGKNQITADDLGITREMMNEISDPGSLNRITDKIFKYSGFRAVDKLGKNVAINSALISARKTLTTQKGIAKMTKELAPAWKEDTAQLIKELKNGEVTDLTKQYVFSKLSKMQPISRSEMPEAFLRMHNGRIFYQLMTWTMKQFSLFRSEALSKMTSGNAKESAIGLKNMLRGVFWLGSMNIASDEAKRFMTKRDSAFTGRDMPTEVAQALINNATKNFFGSSVPWEPNVPTASIFTRLGSKLVAAATTDETTWGDFGAQVTRHVPLVGKMIYYYLMGGAEEFNKKQEAKREASNASQYKF